MPVAVLFSGDFHANAMKELDRITKAAVLDTYGQELFGEIRYHIILGDAGFLWLGNEERDTRNYTALAARPFPILCVVGNHDPILGRPDLPEADIGIGEKVLPVGEEPYVAYLKRGKLYTIDGFTFLVLGGALSVDRQLRTCDVSWWKGEYWSGEEKEAVMELLNRQNCFDYVLSHTGPNRINRTLFQYNGGQYSRKFSDEVAVLNDVIDGRITCKGWFCGHWHKDRCFYDKELKREYRYLYNSTAVLRDDEIIGLPDTLSYRTNFL
jgi:hypothetical protein